MSYLCVDGGQTKTAVRLLDADGEELHAWSAGPLTTPSKPGAAEGLHTVVRGVLQELDRRLAVSEKELPEAACFSLTGYLEESGSVPELVLEETRELAPGIERVLTIPDFVENWAAATRGKPGIVVVSGGGTVAYGRSAADDSLRVGGWGHLLGDEGSGFWIGLEAIKAALRSRAGLIPETALEARIMEALGTTDEGEVLGKVYSGAFTEASIAGLVPLVASLAEAGDEGAGRILDATARHLSAMASAALNRLGALPVYLSGGVFRVPTVEERFRRALGQRGHVAAVTTVAPDPLDGIFLIARDGL